MQDRQTQADARSGAAAAAPATPGRATPLPRLGRGIAALGLALLAVAAPGRAQEEAARPPARPALVLDVQGAIGPATAEYLQQGLEAAREREAGLIVLRIDTPGGLDSSMRDIIRDILASPIPVAAYVAPSGARAASAGTYILYASHFAAMAPGTNLGAATPVQLGGGGDPFGADPGEDGQEEDQPAPHDPMTAKLVNDAVAYIRGLAELHDRDAEWAEEAVRQAASLSARAALENDVIESVAGDLDDLLAQADGRTIRLAGEEVTLATAGLVPVAMEPDWRVRLLAVITDPNIALILMLIGVYGIIFEFFSPGSFFPGVIGGISLLTGLYALNLLPINYAGVALMLLGIALMTAEAFAPSFGVLGIGGMAAFAFGALFMFDEAPGFELSPAVVATATAASVALLAVMLAVVVRAHRRKVVSGDAVLIGAIGRVVAWTGTGGQVQVCGERWHARAAEPLAPGAPVRVRRRENLVLVVEPATPPEA